MSDNTTPTTRRNSRNEPNRRVTTRAVAQVEKDQHLALGVPFLGTIRLPPPQQLAYFGAVGLLLALEVIDWPVAVLIIAGHALTQQQHSRAIQELGEILEES